ncbi:unnamed protein product [Lepeophtheirus salmonis]|nr:unnamed protein product [Lepeophtheirus salmonis]CAF2947368.1 unnamed protein product [Lepeophtheirus salmonis]
MSDTGGDYTTSSITPGQISSDDYSFSEGGHSIHHQDKARHASNLAFNEYSTSTSEAKPPSPSPRRRFPSSSGGVAVSLASPASVKKAVGHNLYQTTTTTTTKTVREHSPYDYQRSSSTTPLTQDYRSTPTSPIKDLEYHKSNQDYSRTTTQGCNQDYSRTTTHGSNNDGGLTSPGGTVSDYGRTTPIPVVHEYNTAAKGNQDHTSRSGGNQEFSSRSGFNQQEFSSRTEAISHQADYGRNTTTSTLHSDASRGISPGRDYTSSHRIGDNAISDYSRSGTMPSTSGIGDGSEPKGAAYYAKYHSSHTHKSQQQHQQHQTHSFPTSGRNTPSFPTTATQQPPKRVDELMTELSEFDSSIHPTNFVEPRPANKMAHTTYINREDDTEYLLKKESSLDGGDQGVKDGHEPMPNIAGPAVYYPPGEMFLSETARDSASAAPLNPLSSSSKRSKGRGKGKSKDKSSNSDGKQGAAVVPICLPLCCAAPCVIM